MLRDRKYYLVNLANLSSVKEDDIGALGIALKSLLAQNVNIPFGFILTTASFDDFLVANDLVEFIAPRINDLDYSNLENIQENSRQIQEAIRKGRFPDLLKEPIEKAYAGLSGFSQANVSLKVSVNEKQLSDSLKGTTLGLDNVYGLDELYENIKILWAEFFSTSAILYRGKVGYEGFLTESIVVQKSMQAEVSGRLYSINPTDNDSEIIEIQAIWGMELPEVLNEVVPDSYFFSKTSAQLIEKKIVSQDHMFVRKAKFDKNEPFLKVQISKMWQNKQKLENKYLFQLFHYTLTLERIFKHPFIMDWVLESGKIYVTEIRDIDVGTSVEEKFPLRTETFIPQKIEDFDGSSVVITPAKQMEDYIEEINTEVNEHHDTSKMDMDIVIAQKAAEGGELMSEDALVDNVDNEIHNDSKFSEEFKTDVEKQIGSANLLARGLSEDALLQDGAKVEVTHETEKKIENILEKVVVDVKPIKELDSVIKGESGSNKFSIYGLTKVVRKSYDLEDLTGDEILVFENISDKDVEFINKVSGAIVQGQIFPNLLTQITVPLVFGNSKLLEEIKDNSVVTIDGQTGKVYLGAGVKDDKELAKESDKKEIENEKIEKIPEEIIPLEEIEPPKSMSVIPKRVELVINDEVVDEGRLQKDLKEDLKTPIPNKVYSVTIDESKENMPINSATEFWQTVDSKKIILDTKNAKGLFLCSDDLYKIFNADMGLVVSDSVAQKSFIKDCVRLIDEVIQKSNRMQLIFLSSSKDQLSQAGFLPRIDDFVNIDLEILGILRNDYGFRNIWYGFNDILTAEELFERKKNVTSEGMRRSVSFKLFACLKESYPLFGIKNIVENNNIDGVIIDVDGLMQKFAGGKRELDDVVVNLIKYVLSFINTNNKLVFLLNNNIGIAPQQIKQMLEAGLNYFVTASNNLMNFKLAFVDQEVSRIERRKKRGRKKKVIDFGF
jgi:phosphoenolpyruvate synthase/pyruvate phosphate dikinase